MGRRGWAGSPPADDDDAQKRIIDAAIRCIQRSGPARVTLSDVAVDLGVTRRTVYRYFATTEELFTAVSQFAFAGWVTRLQTVTAGLDGVTEILVEVLAYIIEQLPDQPFLTLLLATGRPALFSQQMLQPEAIARCRAILEHTGVDLESLGYDNRRSNDLVEFLLRIIQSMVIAPSQPPRTPADLRAVLRSWIGSAVSPATDAPAQRRRRSKAATVSR